MIIQDALRRIAKLSYGWQCFPQRDSYWGGRLGEKFGKRMEVLWDLILIGIGLRILITHIY
jgi:hypothetical protein